MLQIVRAVAAAILAWILASKLLDLPHPYIAPWSALFAIHATVYGTLRSSVKQTMATGAGLLVAFVAGHLFGVNTVTLGIALLATMLLGRWRIFGDENLTAATTVLFVLTLGGVDQQQMLAIRLAEVALGAAAGVLVNVLAAPLWVKDATSSVSRIGGRVEHLLRDLASGLREGWTTANADGWLAETTRIGEQVGQTWRVVKLGTESRWWNPLRSRRQLSPGEARAENLLAAFEHTVADLRSVARTLWRHGPEDEADPVAGVPPELAGLADALESLADVAAELAADGSVDVGEQLRAAVDALPAPVELAVHPGLGSVAANVRNIASELATAAR